MVKPNICACPNLKCPNHGNCKDCTSRHLKIKSLNYCSFYSILPFLKDVIESDPDSKAAGEIDELIRKQSQAYSNLMEKQYISEEKLQELRIKKAEVSSY